MPRDIPIGNGSLLVNFDRRRVVCHATLVTVVREYLIKASQLA